MTTFKAYQAGDTINVPINGKLVDCKILHIPIQPGQMWVVEYEGGNYAIDTKLTNIAQRQNNVALF